MIERSILRHTYRAGSREDSDRFLSLLGVARRPPSLEALTEIYRAFQFTVPFENISKLLSLDQPMDKRMPDLAGYLQQIEQFRLGGTCLTNNPYLHRLLEDLGYDAELRSADMEKNRQVHTCLFVRLEERSYHLDVGFSAPFLTPLPLDSLPAEVSQGPRSYRFRGPDERGGFAMSTCEDGKEIHSYDVNPEPFTAEELGPGIDFSFRDGATFMKCLAITKHFPPDQTKTFRDLQFTERDSQGVRVTKFETLEQAESLVRDVYGVPNEIYRRAVTHLKRRMESSTD